jgi:hypothetical protein
MKETQRMRWKNATKGTERKSDNQSLYQVAITNLPLDPASAPPTLSLENDTIAQLSPLFGQTGPARAYRESGDHHRGKGACTVIGDATCGCEVRGENALRFATGQSVINWHSATRRLIGLSDANEVKADTANGVDPMRPTNGVPPPVSVWRRVCSEAIKRVRRS